MYSGVHYTVVHVCMHVHTCLCEVLYPFVFVDWDLTMATVPFCRHQQDSLGLWRALLSYLRTCTPVALPLSLFNAGIFGYYLPALP